MPLVHLAFGERPQYASPYPDGMAVGQTAAPDDASGGFHNFFFSADGGFLYRLELINYLRGTGVFGDPLVTVTTHHEWARDKSGFPGNSFDLEWPMPGLAQALEAKMFLNLGTWNATASSDMVYQMLRRFPLGTQRKVEGQILLDIPVEQIDTTTNALAVVFTYWRKEAMFVPGFLSSFFEAPAVPPLLRTPTG